MIAVPVGDIDRGEVLAARDDPIQQRLRLLGRKKGVHENGVALTVDECRRIRHPHQLFFAGGQIASKARALYRKHIPLKILVSCVGRTHIVGSFADCARFPKSGTAAAKAPWVATWVTNDSCLD